jgi:hypothetical protein
MNTKTLFFLISQILALSVRQLWAYNPVWARDYAEQYCGALNCTSGADPKYYDDWYRCYQLSLSDSGQSHCWASMWHYYLVNDSDSYYLGCSHGWGVGSDCANFVSEIIQAGCGGLCYSVYWDCGNETMYYTGGHCNNETCGGTAYTVAYVSQLASDYFSISSQWCALARRHVSSHAPRG